MKQEQSNLKCDRCGVRVKKRIADDQTTHGDSYGKECGCADKYIFNFEQHDNSYSNESTE